MSTYDVKSLASEIDVLGSDEYVNLPGCLDGIGIPKDQSNTVIHEDAHGVDHPVTGGQSGDDLGSDSATHVQAQVDYRLRWLRTG